MGNPALANLSGLDWTDIRLLEEISFLAQNDGFCTPSRQYLANTIQVSVRTVSRHLSKLCRLGHLRRQLRSYRRADGTIKNRTNLYRVSLDAAARVKAFLGTIGQRFKGSSTGETLLSHIPKTKEKSFRRKGNPAHRPTLPPPSPAILEKMPLLKRWLERGQTV